MKEGFYFSIFMKQAYYSDHYIKSWWFTLWYRRRWPTLRFKRSWHLSVAQQPLFLSTLNTTQTYTVIIIFINYSIIIEFCFFPFIKICGRLVFFFSDHNVLSDVLLKVYCCCIQFSVLLCAFSCFFLSNLLYFTLSVSLHFLVSSLLPLLIYFHLLLDFNIFWLSSSYEIFS